MHPQERQRLHSAIGITCRIASNALTKRPPDGMVQAIDMVSHIAGFTGGAEDQYCHPLNGTLNTSKGVPGETTMVERSLRYFGMGSLH